jgi:hypothetical protein
MKVEIYLCVFIIVNSFVMAYLLCLYDTMVRNKMRRDYYDLHEKLSNCVDNTIIVNGVKYVRKPITSPTHYWTTQ